MMLEETGRALELAFESFDEGSLNLPMFWLDFPGEKAIRSHSRFMELVRYVGLASYWDSAGWPPFCEPRDDAHFCGLDFAVK